MERLSCFRRDFFKCPPRGSERRRSVPEPSSQSTRGRPGLVGPRSGATRTAVMEMGRQPYRKSGCSIKLWPRRGRKSHSSIVLDPAQSELNDAPVQRSASELRLGRIRRKDFHLPVAQVLDQAVQV